MWKGNKWGFKDYYLLIYNKSSLKNKKLIYVLVLCDCDKICQARDYIKMGVQAQVDHSHSLCQHDLSSLDGRLQAASTHSQLFLLGYSLFPTCVL